MITSILAPVVGGYFARRKTAAEARYEEAQAGKVSGEAYRDIIAALRAQCAGQLIRIGELESAHENDRQVIEVLIEQKVAATTHNQLLTARIAAIQGGDLVNSSDSG